MATIHLDQPEPDQPEFVRWHARNLSELYRVMLGRYGADHPMTRRALSDARHAGADWLGIEPAEPADIWHSYAYRGAAGELVGNREVRASTLADSLPAMIKARAAASDI